MFSEAEIGGYEIWRAVLFFLVILASLAAGRLARMLTDRTAAGYEKAGRQLLCTLLRAIAKSLTVIALALGFWIGALVLDLPSSLDRAAVTVTRVLNSVAVGYALYCLVDVADCYLSRLAGGTASKVDDILAPLVGKSVRITISVLVVLNIVHEISGHSITTILAGLGVGGLAIALAAQDTIRNFFGSLVILGDKPFEIGDRVVIDGHDGPVEGVGFRSTRIRTLEGHVVTVPNSEVVNKTIRNIGKRPHIRRLFNVTVTYDTAPDKVERAVGIIKEILRDHEGMNPEFPPRVYFSEFNDCSLNIIVIYWYHPADYWKYMEFSAGVNMAILRRFNAEGIEFAFPTQTVYLAGSGD